jgi:hypothetical protein
MGKGFGGFAALACPANGRKNKQHARSQHQPQWYEHQNRNGFFEFQSAHLDLIYAGLFYLQRQIFCFTQFLDDLEISRLDWRAQKTFHFQTLNSSFSKIFIVLAACVSLHFPAKATTPFEIFDGDRVVLIGDTLIEREQEFSYLETRLYTRFSGRKFIVRNLGWSADTPYGKSRTRFDFAQPEKGFEQIKLQIEAIKPTVVFIGYGMASSFDGEEGLAKFKSDYGKLIDLIQGISGDKNVRFVLLSPIRHEKLPAPLPDP